MSLRKHSIWIVSATVFFLSVILRYTFIGFLQPGQSVPVINGIIHFTLVFNNGAGFGLLKGYRILLIFFSVAALAAIAYYWKKIPDSYNTMIPIGLITGGILGNLLERISLGHVVDYIDFRFWPVFNIADSAISIGVIWLIIYLWSK